MGLAYTYLGRLDAHRGKLYSGGMKGEKGRKYLEEAMAQCTPTSHTQNKQLAKNAACEDIYFPYGAYSYFAGRLPQLLKLFNFLWFIPMWPQPSEK